MALSALSILKSKTRSSILKLFFNYPGQEYYLRQLEDLTGYSVGNIRREMLKLKSDGILLARNIGKVVLYRLNKTHPLYAEIGGAINKTAGAENQLAGHKNKNVYVIAGPNGSGKTTFARLFLPKYAKCPNFVNADLIAQGLAPFKPSNVAIKAGRLVLTEIDEFAGHGADFAFETTLSGKSYARLFSELKAKGYSLNLFFLWIPSPELAIARIKDRVREGGHNVPDHDVRRRFVRGLRNFFGLYERMFDTWMLFDNSKARPILAAKRQKGGREIIDEELFRVIQESAG